MSASRSTPGRLLYLSGAPRVSTHPDADSGGARAHVLGVVEGFERAGWTVDRFIVGDEIDAAVRSRVSRAVTDASGGAKATIRRIAGDVARLGIAAANARRLARRIDPKVTWAYERFATMQRLGRVAQRRGVPWILETQGPFFHEAANDRRSLALTGLARRRELDAYRRCDALVCVSTALRDLIVDLAGIDPAKVIVVPNGVDERAFDPSRTQRRRLTPESTFTIGYVGGLPPWQALDRLFSALARLREPLGDVAVVVVGDGPSRAVWAEAAERAHLGDRVHWVGRVPRTAVPSYLAGFDVGYSGPIRSSLGSMYHSPLKLYEYLAMGVPVLAADFADARRLVADTGGGVLFTSDDDALDAALLEAAAAHREGRYDATTLRERVLARHSWDRRVETLIGSVDQVLSGGVRS